MDMGLDLLTLDSTGILNERELPNGHHTLAVRDNEGLSKFLAFTMHSYRRSTADLGRHSTAHWREHNDLL